MTEGCNIVEHYRLRCNGHLGAFEVVWFSVFQTAFMVGVGRCHHGGTSNFHYHSTGNLFCTTPELGSPDRALAKALLSICCFTSLVLRLLICYALSISSAMDGPLGETEGGAAVSMGRAVIELFSLSLFDLASFG